MSGDDERGLRGRRPAEKRRAPPEANPGEALEPPAGAGHRRRERHEHEAVLQPISTFTRPAAPVRVPDLAGISAYRMFVVLADHVPDHAVFLMDTRGTITYWGEGARLMKGWTRDEAVGAHLRLLYPAGGSDDGTAEAHLQVAAERGEYVGEGQRLRRDGTTFRAAVTVTALKDEAGRLVGFADVTRDLSACRMVEAALKGAAAASESQKMAEEANRLKDQFVAHVSHEMRAPLSAMLGYVQLLDRESRGRERQRAHLARIKRSGRHLQEILNDLLDLSRLDAGRMTVASRNAGVAAAIEAAVAETEQEADGKGIRLVKAVPGSAADIRYWGDEARVRQILVNLLTNAVKFTPRGGTVTISAGSSGREPDAATAHGGPWTHVVVEDTGEGIAPDRIELIFEPFEQVHDSEARDGVGLGLAISRRLARLMGGDVTVRSTLGAGSAFFLWLPATEPHPVAP